MRRTFLLGVIRRQGGTVAFVVLTVLFYALLQAASSASFSFSSRASFCWHSAQRRRCGGVTDPSRIRVTLKGRHCDERRQHDNHTLIIVDLDNVRGTSKFQWTHEALIESTTEWRNTAACPGGAYYYCNNDNDSLALVIGHGNSSIPCLYTGGPLDDRVGVLFSSKQKADDVIVSLVDEYVTKIITKMVVVVTEDQELLDRCRQVASMSTKLDHMEPCTFFNEIESLSDHSYMLSLTEHGASSSSAKTFDANSAILQNAGDQIRLEVALRQELQMIDTLLHPRGTRPNGKKRQVSKKQRTKLVTRRDRTIERLQEILQNEDEARMAKAVLQPNSDSSARNGVFQAIKGKQVSSFSTESTYERQLLAERFRRRLDGAGAVCHSLDDIDLAAVRRMLWNARNDRGDGTSHSLTRTEENESLVRDGRSLSSTVLTVPRRFHNGARDHADNLPSTLLRIVTISDTHGYEHELFVHSKKSEKPYLLPSADVLIHCGDFAACGSRTIKLQSRQRLDNFLAAQRHIPIKIVIRGNHDPHTPGRVLFPRSKASYVTKPTTVTLPHNVTLGIRPFSRRGSIVLLPPCDILASHEPPFGILDLTYQRLRAGSMMLRRAVESSSHKPSLWVCGHIHEGRGSVLHTFADEHVVGTPASTLVVNAANANAGRANRIVTGPVLIDVVRDESVLSNDSAWTVRANADSSPAKLEARDTIQDMMSSVERSLHPMETDSRRLLAVDLGLRTATVVLNGKGDTLDVQDWRFTDHPQLEGALQGILYNHSITHVVVGGSDAKLIHIWRRAVEKCNPNLPFSHVVAEDWREALLLPKERKNTQVAKDAAVLIAKQFWKSKVTKDAAEAILVGQYAIRVLGWVEPHTPIVKRYTNGDIMR